MESREAHDPGGRRKINPSIPSIRFPRCRPHLTNRRNPVDCLRVSPTVKIPAPAHARGTSENRQGSFIPWADVRAALAHRTARPRSGPSHRTAHAVCSWRCRRHSGSRPLRRQQHPRAHERIECRQSGVWRRRFVAVGPATTPGPRSRRLRWRPERLRADRRVRRLLMPLV